VGIFNLGFAYRLSLCNWVVVGCTFNAIGSGRKKRTRFLEELEGVREGKELYLVLHRVYYRRLFSRRFKRVILWQGDDFSGG